MKLLLNLDVPELAAAERFYHAAFGLIAGRRFGDDAVEMTGAEVPIYLLHKDAGRNRPGPVIERDYTRHWTPVHGDVVVDDMDEALIRAIAAGATQEGTERELAWGRIVQLSDPFGHGWCLLQFRGLGYDEIAT